MFFFDAHAVLFTVRILGASSYETRRANDTASILVATSKGRNANYPFDDTNFLALVESRLNFGQRAWL